MDGFDSLKSVTIGDGVCHQCSVFSLESNNIESLHVHEQCFQGNSRENDRGIPPHRFSIKEKPILERIEIGRSSFTYFNQFELKSRYYKLLEYYITICKG